MEVRQGANARDVKGYDTERLRNDFLIQNLFPADDFKLVYSQIDRIIVGGCMPVNKELTLEAGSELKAAYFLERREMGIFNVGGNGSVIVDGTEYKFKYRDGLYIGMGSKEIKFKSEDSSKPAKFYFNSTPAHKTYPTVFIDPEKDIKDEFKLQLGSVEGCNKRLNRKYILPGQVETCQLEMGITTLEPGSVWNTMPCHTHDRRMEVYFYFEIPEEDIRNKRISIGVEEAWEGVHVSGTPDSAYYYSTYNAEDKNPVSTDKQKIMILGGGPNRIGQGIEFDYCCVHASQALKKMGFETIIVNCNPETVSTDYDTSDKLYFEPLTVEDVLSIYNKEKPLGVIAQFGGQTPLNIAAELEKNGVKILGTSPSVIDLAEDRDLFREMMDKLEIPMPESGMATTVEEALEIAGKIGYPVMVRPSYVLGGRGMEVVYDDESMAGYMKAAVGVTPDRPILIDRFLNHAMECEADAISDGTHAFVPAVMEHIELAGVHSGDSACILPSVHISEENLETIKEYTRKIAEEMHVKGLMNMQYAIEDDKVYVLEANPRASRTVPLVSKVCNVRMVPLATQIITSELTGKPSPVPELKEKAIPYYGVKEAAFPFNMFQEVDPVLGPEMRSTGEVLGLSKSYGEAFYKAQEGVGAKLPLGGTVLISVNRKDKEEVVEVAKAFADDGFKILATENTCKLIKEAGIEAEKVNKLSEGRPNILDLITNGNIDIIVNSPVGKDSVNDDSYLRKGAIKAKIPYYTTIAAAKAAAEGIAYVKAHQDQNEEVNSLQGLHAQISDKF